MLEMSGEERFEQDADRVYAVATDLNLIAQNIPDLVSYELAGLDQLNCVVRPGFSFLRMSMKARIHLLRDVAERTARLRIASQGIGASMEVESELAVVPADGGSLLRWSARVAKRTGLVSTVSPDLVRAAAEQVIRTGWGRLRGQLGPSQ